MQNLKIGEVKNLDYHKQNILTLFFLILVYSPFFSNLLITSWFVHSRFDVWKRIFDVHLYIRPKLDQIFILSNRESISYFSYQQCRFLHVVAVVVKRFVVEASWSHKVPDVARIFATGNYFTQIITSSVLESFQLFCVFWLESFAVFDWQNWPKRIHLTPYKKVATCNVTLMITL